MNIFQNRDRFFGKPNFISIRGNMDEFWRLGDEIKSELGDKGYYLDKYLSVIFETLADLDFGKPNFISIRGNMDEFWRLGDEIKSELGDKGYYLDKYLSVIFETLADLDLGTASVVADNLLCSDIFRDCCIVCCGDNDLIRGKEKSKFFEIVKKYIDEHPIDFNENRTKVEFYTGKILTQNLELLYEEFKKRYIAKVFKDIDYPIASKYFEKISSIIGEAKMEQFNDILGEAFILSPIGLSAIEHFISYTIGTFLYRDPERSKMLYQLMTK